MKKPISVLMLEENSALETTIAREFQRYGVRFDIKRVTSRDGFLRELQCHPPDIILADGATPPSDALAIAKENRPDVPFVYVLPRDQLADANGNDDVLKLPLSKLVSAMRQEIRKAKDRRRLKEMELMVLTERWARPADTNQRTRLRNGI
jgi:DNA-binding response OmpR family regulator